VVDDSATPLKASMVSGTSDLDCSGGIAPDIQIVALSGAPLGNILLSSGDGTVFSQFKTIQGNYTFSPAIATTTTTKYVVTETMAGQAGAPTGVTAMLFSDSGRTDEDAPATVTPLSLVSATDVSQAPRTGYGNVTIVAFDEKGRLERLGMAPPFWYDPSFYEPPPDASFQYSPSICFDTPNPNSPGFSHLVAVAGDRVWYASSGGGWEKMTDIAVASAPDCTVTWDGTVHAVALTATGSILHVWGTPGNFSAIDLGTY
jgi:hypothetical protein